MLHLLGILWVCWDEMRRRDEESRNVAEGLGTHPDQHVVGKGGGVVYLCECRRASAHYFPAHVEHPCAPQGQQGHSEEEAPIPEHTSILKGHHKARMSKIFKQKCGQARYKFAAILPELH